MKRNERLALSSFSMASITSGNIAPTRQRTSCHRPGFGGNARPVYLRALTLSDTPGVDGEGGYFLLEDLHQLVKPIAAHNQVSGRDLPITARKQRPARPRLAPDPQQSALPPSRAIYRSAYSSPLRGPPGFPSKIKTSDLTGWSSSLGDNRIRSRQIQVSHALQDTWKILKAANRSNVHISMLYLGTGSTVSTQNPNHQDEVKVFQQICGAENICVYKGHLVHREQFQFVSRRHFAFLFSVTIHVNGLVAARISWCCEHKYPVGFQLGKRSCFRLMGIRGGIPCHRCLKAWPYQGHGSKQKADVTQPGRETDFNDQDERSQQGKEYSVFLINMTRNVLKQLGALSRKVTRAVG
ncbi:uncharacterized protein LOC129711994 [Leucoraja erinacea]|uniref:uncharacterized protein LOC129711994 n=1 Tax=Leucoraja erinaceus TaxID=7782 RepID=UPI002456F340|nr:uncharacterized protein LOC129711994 [Leucoraja erinacea]